MGQHDDERMDRITQMLEEGVENVFTSENYANWLRTMSRFHTYSWRNQLLISMQTAGTATQVAGYSTWKSLGRQVRKGEKGIWILAPVTIKVPKTPERVVQDDLGNEHDEDRLRVVAFKPAVVFDVSQTEGKELPSMSSLPTTLPTTRSSTSSSHSRRYRSSSRPTSSPMCTGATRRVEILSRYAIPSAGRIR